MSGRQDVIDVFSGERTGLHTIFTQSVTVGQMDACGTHWPEAHFDPKLMAELSLQTHRMFGCPTAHIPFRVNIESEAFGCKLGKGTLNAQPAVTEYPYSSDFGLSDIPDDIISVDEFMSKKCIRDVIDASRIVHDTSDVFTVSCMNGPSALVMGLVGMENMLIGMISEPDLLQRWIDTAEPYVYAYMSELSKVSDGIMVIDGASSDITPPESFNDIVGRRLRSMFRRKENYIILHSCGNTIDIAPELASLGEDILSPEASSCQRRYFEAVSGRTLLAGCVNPITALLMGTPELIKEQCRESEKTGFAFITPECGVPPMTPNENLKTFLNNGFFHQITRHI